MNTLSGGSLRGLVLVLLIVLLLSALLTTPATAQDRPKLAALSVQVDDPSMGDLAYKLAESLGSVLICAKEYELVSYSMIMKQASINDIHPVDLNGHNAKPIIEELGLRAYVQGRVFSDDEGRMITLQLIDARSGKIKKEVTEPFVGPINQLLTIKMRKAAVQLFE